MSSQGAVNLSRSGGVGGPSFFPETMLAIGVLVIVVLVAGYYQNHKSSETKSRTKIETSSSALDRDPAAQNRSVKP